MSCNENTICDEINIIQGEDKSWILRFKDCRTGYWFDFVNTTAIKAIFKGTNGNVEITLAAAKIAILGATSNGRLQFKPLAVDTNLMLIGTLQDFQVEVTESVFPFLRKWKVKKLLNVEASF